MMLRLVFVVILLFHGLIHLMGFVKAFGWAEFPQLHQSISRVTGLWWLTASALYLSAGILYLTRVQWWPFLMMAAIIASQILIILYWQDAKFGTIANTIALLVAVTGIAGWLFQTSTLRERQTLLSTGTAAAKSTTLRRAQITHLPSIVQTWLQRAKVIDKPLPRSVYLRQRGTMRTSPTGKWMPFRAEQWISIQPPGFLWNTTVDAGMGLYLSGRDLYAQSRGHMLIKLLSLFPVADAKGPEIDQGAMLRFLAEIVWAPTAALSPSISWEEVDATSAKATIRYGGITASGIFGWTKEGDFLHFTAKRYYSQKSKSSLETWRIDVVEDNYREQQGIRIPTQLQITWKLAAGDYLWYRVAVQETRYHDAPKP